MKLTDPAKPTFPTLVVILMILASLMRPVAASGQWREMQFDDGDMAQDLAEALTFTKYPTYGQYVEMMNFFATEYPGICRLDTFGTSVEGRLLLALKISANPGAEEQEANFLYTSTMHGNETVGYVLLLRLAQFLLSNYGSDTEVDRLLDNLAVWINPLFNPDGSFSAGNDLTLSGAVRFNASGTDLNRNFPDPGTGQPDDTTGRAKETRQMMQFMKEHHFTLSANMHSGDEVVNYPWDYTYDLHADDDWYRFVSREYADEARAVDPEYMGLFTDGITNGAEWYKINGGRQDYVNYYLEGREVTLELSYGFLLDSDNLEDFWNINERSLLNYMSQCLYGIRGTVTDSVTGQPVAAMITIPGHDSIYSVVHSSSRFGDFYRLIKEGVYDLVVSAPGYLPDTLYGVEVTDYEATLLQVKLVPGGLSVPKARDQDPVLKIFPNPAGQRVYVEPAGLAPGTIHLRIYSTDGRLEYHDILYYEDVPLEVDLSGFHRGLHYFMVSSDEFAWTRKLVVTGD